MRKKVLLGTGILIGVALLFAVFSVFPFSELVQLLLHMRGDYLLAYLGVSFIIMLMLTYRWKVICDNRGVKVSFKNLVLYKYVGFAVSFITPGPRFGGEPVRAAMMKREKVPFAKALSTVIADKTVEATSFGTMFVIALGMGLLMLELPQGLRLAMLASALIILALLIYGFNEIIRGRDPVLKLFKLFRLHKIKALQKYEKELQEFEHAILDFYKKGKKCFWKAQLVSAFAWSLSLIEFKLVLLLIGIDANFLQVFLVYCVVGLMYTIPIPLALGTLEAGQASLLAALGFRASSGAAVALITRSRDILWTVIGFIILGYYGFDSVKDVKQ